MKFRRAFSRKTKRIRRGGNPYSLVPSQNNARDMVSMPPSMAAAMKRQSATTIAKDRLAVGAAVARRTPN